MNYTPDSDNRENTNKPDSLLILKQYHLFEKLSPVEYEALTVLDNYREAKPGEFIYFEAFQHQLIYFRQVIILTLNANLSDSVSISLKLSYLNRERQINKKSRLLPSKNREGIIIKS